MDTINTQSVLSTGARIRRVALGSVFLGIVMGASGPLGYLTLLALLAIYPLISGLIGTGLVAQAFGQGRQPAVSPAAAHRVVKSAVQAPSVASRRHWFSHGAGPKAA